ncbi:serine hydrolase [Candidatus Woesearchaeota archaeon]|nr:serine hydrolase [Candidatus Woesearchaeota archaeon]
MAASRTQMLIAALAVSTAVLLIVSLCLLVMVMQPRSGEDTMLASPARFHLLNPGIAQLEVTSFEESQKYYTTNYQGLRQSIGSLLVGYGKGEFGIYFEDLNTGSWIGINERDQYHLASLLKIADIATMLRKVEEGELRLDTRLTLTQSDIDRSFGVLQYKAPGTEYTLLDIMNITLYYSDNTAANMLERNFRWEDQIDAILGLGIPYSTLMDKNGTLILASAKEYSNVFRSLYYSSYLKRSSSQLFLSLLSDTNFNDGIAAGVPQDVTVAHKIGFWIIGSEHHDCGIVYHPNRPYILCVMTKGLTEREANLMIGEVSRKAWEFMDQE